MQLLQCHPNWKNKTKRKETQKKHKGKKETNAQTQKAQAMSRAGACGMGYKFGSPCGDRLFG
jgi:hypothetical protein